LDPDLRASGMLVQEFLEASAQRRPDKVALVCGAARFSYAQLDLMANRLALALRARGVRRGDRVAIYLRNRPEAVVAIFAALKADAAFVVINRTTKREKLARILSNCRAAALVTDASVPSGEGGGHWQQDCPSLRVVVTTDDAPMPALEEASVSCSWAAVQATYPAERPRCENIDLDLACLIYTSGTTGEPKGVMSDHANVVFASGSIIQYLGNTEEDVVLGLLPLSFDYGLYQLLMAFRFGGTLVLEDSFAFPLVALQRIAEERVTGFPGVPTIFAMLLQLDLEAFDLSSLRYITNTAAALPPSHIQQLRRKLPWVTLYSMYGLTETKRALYLPPQLLESKPGSVGVAIPGTEAWLEDAAGQRLGPDEVGELVIRGRHVMRGYWEAPEATAERFRPGPIPGERLCYSGDLFRMDADGCMYFLGRKDDIIKSRGEKVSPKEIENVLHALAGVVDAAVLGVPDPILGQAIKAVIVRTDSRLGTSEVLAHCKAHLEDFLVPKIIEFRDALPRTLSGKVRKEELA
jgi:amino acid adenylation domain-containing protein